ncbi:MAG: hypothetical protein AAGC67_08005 [Myxococcota bacterium]
MRLSARILAIACLSAALLACASGPNLPRPPAVSAAPPAPSLERVPAWALADPSREADVEIGVGSGTTLDEATRYALQDVASRLSVSIESALTDRYEESDGRTVESLEQVIETRVAGTRFTGWRRTRSAERDGTFWAEVRIDRRRLAAETRSELVRLADEIDAEIGSARGSALRRLIALEHTAIARERVGHLVSLVDVLELDFDRGAWEARRADWRSIDETARRALVFEVRADPASREVASWIETRLVADRLRTRNGECRSPDAICIDIRSEITETDVASRHVAKIRSTLAVLEPGGTVVRESERIGRGASKSDPDRARRKALDDLRDSLTAFSVLDEAAGR